MNMDTFELHNILPKIVGIWNKQSKPRKYITIISISIPSYLLLREIYWFIFRKYHSLPPGPNGWPIFGTLYQWFGSHHTRIHLAQKYGPIFHSTVMGMPAITISSSKLMKKIFTQNQFLNRFSFNNPKTDYYHDVNSCGKSNAPTFLWVNGDEWVKRRKLAQDTLFRVLNRATVGKLLKATMETEFSPYLNDIIKSNKPWSDPQEILEYIALNTIYSDIP